jgi:hypothetical protein
LILVGMDALSRRVETPTVYPYSTRTMAIGCAVLPSGPDTTQPAIVLERLTKAIKEVGFAYGTPEQVESMQRIESTDGFHEDRCGELPGRQPAGGDRRVRAAGF